MDAHRVSVPLVALLYFLIILIFLFKTRHLDMFPFPRLVNIQINGLICWTVGLNGVIWVRSALVGWPGDVSSIERPDDGLIPESFLAVDVQRQGLDDTRPTTIQATMSPTFLFLSLFPFPSTSASSIL
jgi:hypothetical protein